MSKVVLKAVLREETGKKMRAIRNADRLPVVVYGNDIAARNLWVPFLDFSKMYRVAGESTIIDLEVEGEKTVNVLVHDIQIDPLSGRFTHVDLLQVHMNQPIEAHIPLEFTGEAPAVKTLGGMLLKNADEIMVSCLPADLPHAITVDISSLATFDDHITVSDLKLSSKVTVLSDAEMIIAGVVPPRTEAEIADLDVKAEVDVTKVEGIVKEAKTETK